MWNELGSLRVQLDGHIPNSHPPAAPVTSVVSDSHMELHCTLCKEKIKLVNLIIIILIYWSGRVHVQFGCTKIFIQRLYILYKCKLGGQWIWLKFYIPVEHAKSYRMAQNQVHSTFQTCVTINRSKILIEACLWTITFLPIYMYYVSYSASFRSSFLLAVFHPSNLYSPHWLQWLSFFVFLSVALTVARDLLQTVMLVLTPALNPEEQAGFPLVENQGMIDHSLWL